jgi:hypothetical protein
MPGAFVRRAYKYFGVLRMRIFHVILLKPGSLRRLIDLGKFVDLYRKRQIIC